MKEYSIKYLDKSYSVDEKTLEIYSRNDIYSTSTYNGSVTEIHPKDLQKDLTSVLGIDNDLASLAVNEWMYSHGIRGLTDRWEKICWSNAVLCGSNATAIVGYQSNTLAAAHGNNSITLAAAHGNNSIAIGMNAQAIGHNSIAIGNGAIARDGEISISTNNSNQNYTSPVLFNGIDVSEHIGEALNHYRNVHPFE
jgi:hypothetical protein